MDHIKALRSAEDSRIRELEARFLESIRGTIEGTDWHEIEMRLLSGNAPDMVTGALAWGNYDPTDILEGGFWAASGITAEYLEEIITTNTKVSLTLTDPNALAWIDKYAADEIVAITDSQRAAVKEIVQAGYRDGITYQKQAREIKKIVGLDPRRANAVRNLESRLRKKGRFTEDQIAKKSDKYAKRLLNQRARTIAVQEATTAGAQGFYETTKDAVRRGILDPLKYTAYRIVTGDDRLCPDCSVLAYETRSLPDGVYPSTGSHTPKVHVLCRCVEGVREIGKIQAKRASGVGQANIVFDCQGVKRKDGILHVPTIPLVEGVYEQWGLRVFRDYGEFSQYSHWLHGVPVVVNHEDVSPEARRIGQLFDITNKSDGRKTSAVTRFYEIDLTQRELDALLSGNPHDGSLRWECYLVDEPGSWTNPVTGETKEYDVREVGPYVFHEYSFVKQGVISTQDGAGFNMQCKDCKSSELSNAPGGADMETEQMKALLDEAIGPLVDRIDALEQKNAALEGEQQSIKETMAARVEAEQKERFLSKIKPAFLQKAEELWQECKQAGYLEFEAKHPEMIVSHQTKELKGQAMVGNEPEFNLAAKQAERNRKFNQRRR
jgi:hypothetical protein